MTKELIEIDTGLVLESSDLTKQRVSEMFVDEMTRDRFRLKVQTIFDERVETVSFKTKIQQYAADEINTKIFKSITYYFSVIGIPICVSVTTLWLQKLFS